MLDLLNGREMGPEIEAVKELRMKERASIVASEMANRLRIAKDEDRGVYVQNLTEVSVTSPEQIFQVLSHSIAKRATAETLCNKMSSRSHAIFTVNITVKERDQNGALTGESRIGKLNLVDLSGSENIKRSGSVEERATEARFINEGLLVLGRVIKARTEGQDHVPFRDSKLTRLLEESLGGNCVTTLILCISPNHREISETLSTLNYANTAKVIETKPTRLRVSMMRQWQRWQSRMACAQRTERSRC